LVSRAGWGLEVFERVEVGSAIPARWQSAQAGALQTGEVKRIVRLTQRDVTRWFSGEMALRWSAAGMLEAERQFRKIIGYRDLATFVVAIERDYRRHTDTAHTATKGGPLSSQRSNVHTGTDLTQSTATGKSS
jgi:hypothetical protein